MVSKTSNKPTPKGVGKIQEVFDNTNFWGKGVFMKIRISATIDKKTENAIDSLLKKGKFRNKSHVIEEAIILLKGVENDKE